MSRTILYIDPWSGVSGDMLLAALLDTDRNDGRLEALLRGVVAALGISGAKIEIVRDVEWGISCTRVAVHDTEPPPLRCLTDMVGLVEKASLPERVRRRSVRALRRLAEVEAAIHSCSPEEVHFHEVGATDTLVDVVGMFALIDALEVEHVKVGRIPLGGGTIETSHGRMGVPAPATVRLLEGFEVVGGPEMRELTTPTGALLMKELEASSGPAPPMQFTGVGYGAGSMKLEDGPNVLRAFVGKRATEVPDVSLNGGTDMEWVIELQTNIDNVSPEVIGYACRALREAGALDVWTTPASMKKDRTGVVLHALVQPGSESRATEVLFCETGTLGVRRTPCSRRVAQRGTVVVAVEESPVRVKWGRWRDRQISLAAEYEDAAAAAASARIPLREAMRLAVEAAHTALEGSNAGPSAIIEPERREERDV